MSILTHLILTAVLIAADAEVMEVLVVVVVAGDVEVVEAVVDKMNASPQFF